MKKIIPYHIQYAIDNEEKCIELRKKQIVSYKKRIKLLKKGVKMGEINKEITVITPDFRYSVKYYWQLRYEWENEHGRKKEM